MLIEASPGLLMFVLLIALQIKHFIADVPLQSHFLAQKCGFEDHIRPVVYSALIHGVLTIVIFLPAVSWIALGFGLFDGVLHFLVDYWRTRLIRYTVYQQGFWVTLGVDHLLHGLTYVAMAFIATRGLIIATHIS